MSCRFPGTGYRAKNLEDPTSFRVIEIQGLATGNRKPVTDLNYLAC
jgi:hypothetical protein